MDLFIPALAASHHHHHHALHPHHASPFPHGLEIPANFAQHLIESTTSWIQRNSAAAVGQATSSSAIPGHQHHRQQQHHHHHATQIHVIHDPIIFPASAAAAAAAHAAAASSGMPSASSGSSAIESDVSPSTSLSSYSPSSCSSSNQENNGSISHPVPCNLLLDVHKGKAIRLRVKVAVPVEDHPNFNFVGKLLGPRGQSLKWLQQQTQTKMAILGKGSMRDKQKEAELRRDGDPKHNHLREDLHVEITTYAPAPEAYARIAKALVEVKRFLVPDYYDEIRQQQLKELGIIIPDKRVSACVGSGALIASSTAGTAAGHMSNSSASSCGSPSGEESLPSPLNELNARPGNDVPSPPMLTTVFPAAAAAASAPSPASMSSCHVQHSTFLHTKMKHSYGSKSKCSHAPHATKQHAPCHHHCSCCCSSGSTGPAHQSGGKMMEEEEVSTSAESPAESSAGHGLRNTSSTTTIAAAGSLSPATTPSCVSSLAVSSPASSALLPSSSSSWRAGFCRQRPYPSVR